MALLAGLSCGPASARAAPTRTLTSSLEDFQPPGTSPTGVSCMSRGVCVAVDEYGRIDALSGTRSAELTSIRYPLSTVSCSSPDFCMALGMGLAFEMLPTGNRVFSLGGPHTPLGLIDWRWESCPNPAFCMAGGYVESGRERDVPVDARWNGIVWTGVAPLATEPSSPRPTVITAISCTGRTFCMAAGTDGRILRWNGTHWTRTAVRIEDDTYDVSCVSTRFCLAVGNQTSAVDEWDGRSWHPSEAPPLSSDGGGDLSCDSVRFCVAANDNEVSAWNGRSWTSPRRLGTTQFVLGLSCAAGSCEAVDPKGHYAYIYDPQEPPRLPVFCDGFTCPGQET